jgi:hypothetical protein
VRAITRNTLVIDRLIDLIGQDSPPPARRRPDRSPSGRRARTGARGPCMAPCTSTKPEGRCARRRARPRLDKHIPAGGDGMQAMPLARRQRKHASATTTKAAAAASASDGGRQLISCRLACSGGRWRRTTWSGPLWQPIPSPPPSAC